MADWEPLQDQLCILSLVWCLFLIVRLFLREEPKVNDKSELRMNQHFCRKDEASGKGLITSERCQVNLKLKLNPGKEAKLQICD